MAIEAKAALVEAGATAIVERNQRRAVTAATAKAARTEGAEGCARAGSPTVRTVNDPATEPTVPRAQDGREPRISSRPSPAARPATRRPVWVKALVGIIAMAALTGTGFVVYEQTRPGLQAADLLQKIDVARFAGVQTGGVYEWSYGAPNNLCRKGPDGGSDWSEHEWGDPSVTHCLSNPGSSAWAVLVDLSHYSSQAESSLDSTTFISADQQHGNASALGYSYHAVTAPSGMTAMATTAYSFGSHHTRQDLEIVDGAYRVHVEVVLEDTPGQPLNDISQIAELIFKRMPAPPGTTH
ncbi:hypothetical protein [Kitasatospora sp. NPDC056181]|uniref:hypothetical protein n=1 Tax=Kitasatospora sp. NPDC056181 TaxID=3345737 RepID=UPI0035E26887